MANHGYLPMDCPACERRRLLGTKSGDDWHDIKCEKCRWPGPGATARLTMHSDEPTQPEPMGSGGIDYPFTENEQRIAEWLSRYLACEIRKGEHRG